MSEKKPVIAYHGMTDIGNVRKNNEDVFLVDEVRQYCLVADGMGGAAAGEVASRIFADTAKRVFSGHDGQSLEATIKRVKATFKLANDKILAHAKKNPESYGMGCTAELMAFSGSHFVIGHVGDSRTYRMKDHLLKRLTKDHSLVQDQVDSGLITPEEARHHPMRNVILRAVGVNRMMLLDVLNGDTSAGDLFVLCSDGLTDMVEEATIESVLAADMDVKEKTLSLVTMAKEAGGKDNVTAVLVSVM